ncbi:MULTISPECIES: serine/threonine-protein kinase [Rothia]|uniref:non-specific serine/threonine protein kinase n=1 Tax=Rothia nasimurium TaxID=85336 RepID=A0A1Y1RPW4_9MICC|nr:MULTISPECIES: serine/threonine-protein kinase [Rothia]ORC18924.1 hypothetical protein A7979_02720 [Rothia nasimurium]
MSDSKSAAPWLTGVIFKGHFEVGHLIARGGMAEVYYAVDLWSNNPVAVKVLLPHLAGDPAQQQKFFREGRALKKINHEHVVGVVDEGTQLVHGQQVMFLVLEYVHGCTLAQLLTLRPVLSVGEVLHIILPAVEGLSEVHAHQLIHRDIKPANILLEAGSGSIKLSDFGLTRRADQSATGQLMGTPPFIAPEILDAQATVGPEADIFAVGVMMYRMLTGRMPFEGGENDQQVLYHNVNTDIPSVALLAPRISSDVAGVVNWATRRNPGDRPADAAELYRALRDVESGMTPQEQAYRLPSADPAQTSLWEDIDEIAERSGRRHTADHESIVAVGGASDLLFDEDAGASLSAHEQAVRSAAAAPVEAYSPTELTGLGPLTASQAEVEFDARYTISAGYSPDRAARQWADSGQADTHRDAPSSQRNPDPAHWTEAQRRTPAEPWRPAPSTTVLALTALGVLLAFVGAGMVGWWLASFLL